MSASPAFHLVQAAGLLGAAWLSGNMAALSLLTIPALTHPSILSTTPAPTLARQWHIVYRNGRAQNPPVAAMAAACFAYLAWTLRGAGASKASLYGVAAVFTVGIVPWTGVAMTGTNRALIARAEGRKTDGSGGEGETVELLGKWGRLNGVRSLLPLIGGAVGLFAALS